MGIKFDLDPDKIYTLNYLRVDDNEPDSVRFTNAYYIEIIDGYLFIYDRCLIMSFVPGRWKSIICRNIIYSPDLLKGNN
jgi:hypothetical protein